MVLAMQLCPLPSAWVLKSHSHDKCIVARPFVCCSVEKAGGDMELAMELWWRAGALQALATLLEVAVLGGLLGKQRMEQQVGGDGS